MGVCKAAFKPFRPAPHGPPNAVVRVYGCVHHHSTRHKRIAFGGVREEWQSFEDFQPPKGAVVVDHPPAASVPMRTVSAPAVLTFGLNSSDDGAAAAVGCSAAASGGGVGVRGKGSRSRTASVATVLFSAAAADDDDDAAAAVNVVEANLAAEDSGVDSIPPAVKTINGRTFTKRMGPAPSVAPTAGARRKRKSRQKLKALSAAKAKSVSTATSATTTAAEMSSVDRRTPSPAVASSLSSSSTTSAAGTAAAAAATMPRGAAAASGSAGPRSRKEKISKGGPSMECGHCGATVSVAGMTNHLELFHREHVTQKRRKTCNSLQDSQDGWSRLNGCVRHCPIITSLCKY
jgi:hypothetical protein